MAVSSVRRTTIPDPVAGDGGGVHADAVAVPFPSAKNDDPAPPPPHANGTGTGGTNTNNASSAAGNRAYHVVRLEPRVFVMLDAAAAEGSSAEATMADHPIFSSVFILDSGASVHATGDSSLFPFLLPPEVPEIATASGHRLAVHGQGTVLLEKFRLSNVLCVPGLTSNVVSVSKLAELGYGISFFPTGRCVITEHRTNKEAGSARLVGGLYQIEWLEIPQDSVPAAELP